MKQLILLSILAFALPAVASCKQYIPGHYDSRGVYVPGHYAPAPCRPVCRPTETFLGSLLGGGVAASMSRGNGYAWSVPVGAAVGGFLFGCN